MTRRLLPFDPWHLVLAPLALLMVTPLLWMLVTSIKPPSCGEAAMPSMIGRSTSA